MANYAVRKLANSQTRKLANSLSFSAAMFLLSGCSTAVVESPAVNHTIAPKKEIILDAGVVLADRTGYLCVPFFKLDIDESAQIMQVTSSCNCIEPKVVRYQDVGGRLSQAILFAYRIETTESSDSINASPVNLRVEVALTLADGQIRRVYIDLLHSYLANLQAAEFVKYSKCEVVSRVSPYFSKV